MEHFQITLSNSARADIRQPVLCGVVSSGNLEVLMMQSDSGGICTVDVNTSAVGFRDVWQAVLADFNERHALGGMKIAINDAGATPAVVSLRLRQAYESTRSETQ